MATHLRDNTAVETAVDVVDAIAAALESDPLTASLAPVWTAMVTDGDVLAGKIRVARRGARRARSRLWVLDAIWDALTKGFDRAALDFAEGHRDSPSYQQYFRNGETSAVVTKYGIDREVSFARGLIAKLAERLAVVGDLAVTWHPKILSATDALDTAGKARADAVTAMGPLLTGQYLYVENVNLEIDRVEGSLQQIFPGDAKRVASYLLATRRDDGGVPDAAPEPSTPPAGGTPHL